MSKPPTNLECVLASYEHLAEQFPTVVDASPLQLQQLERTTRSILHAIGDLMRERDALAYRQRKKVETWTIDGTTQVLAAPQGEILHILQGPASVSLEADAAERLAPVLLEAAKVLRRGARDK